MTQKKREVATQLGKQLGFALRSLNLNNYRRKPRVLPSDQFDSMWSMLEAFRLSALATIIESKSKQSGLAAGWGALHRQVSGKDAQSRLARKLRAISGIEGMVLSKIAKSRAEMMGGISDLGFCGSALRNDQKRRMKAAVIMQMFRAYKAKAFQVLRQLANGSMEFELTKVRREREQMAYAVPDFDELDRAHKVEMSETLKQATQAAAIRRMEYAFLAKKRRAFDRLNSKTDTQSIVDPKLARIWVINLLALRQRDRLFRATQILRFPTLARHQKQTAAERIRGVLDGNVARSSRLVLNRLMRPLGHFSGRYQPLLEALQRKARKNTAKSFYCLLSEAKGTSGVGADRLAAVAWIANRITSFQTTHDQRLKVPCLTKLGALLDPETPTGAAFHSQAYTFDLLIEKRLKLEREIHPKILSKLNAKAEAAEIRRKIADLKLDIAVLTKNLENHRESTRKLQPLRENEIRDLIARRNLGFSYEVELRKMLGDMWGPSKMHRGEQHSLSHVNEAGEQTNRTMMDQSVSKNVELEGEESSPGLGNPFRMSRLGVESEYQPVPDTSKSQSTFKLNHSEKLLREMESKKLIKRLKELSLDSLVEQQGPAVDEVLGHLVATKAELEGALERLVSDLNEAQLRAVEEADRVELLSNKVGEVTRQKVRFEMRLIDFQDRKGNLALEKTTTSHRNEEIRTDIDTLQEEISGIQAAPTLDPTHGQRLDKLRTEYFEKAELAQRNSSMILKLDQELLEVGRSISGMAEQAAAFKQELGALEDAKKESEGRLAMATRRLNELRVDVRELLSQIAMNVTLIESLEMKKRRIGGSGGEQTSDRSAIELFSRFKEGFIRLNDLRLQKARLVAQQCEVARELESHQNAFQQLNPRPEATGREGSGDHSSGDISDLNLKRKQAAANQDRLARRMSSLSSEVKEVKKNIESESEKLKDFIEEHDDSPRKNSESSHLPENRTDFLSKNSAYMSTRADFGTTDLIENSTVRENLLNLSKSSLADDNVKTLLVSRLNPEAREVYAITEQTPLGTAAFDEALAAVIAKKKAYLQNNQLTFFSFLKKEEIEDRIRGNSCEILDAKEKIAAREIAIKNLRKRLRDLGLKMGEAEGVIAMHRPRPAGRSVGGAAGLTTTHTQTGLEETLYGLRFTFDKPDPLLPRKKGVGMNLDSIFETTLFPKRRERAICKLEPLITKKKVNLNNYLDIEAKDLFDGRPEELIVGGGIKFDLNESGIKDSLVLDEYFPVDGMKKSVRKMYVRRQLESYLAPSAGDNVQSIHDTVRKAALVEPLSRPAPRKVMEISRSAKILGNANYEDPKTKAVQLLAKRIPAAIRNAANLNFYHLKLVASNQRLQQMMAALSRFRVSRLNGRLNDVQGRYSNQSAVALIEAVQAVALGRKRHAFQRMHAKLNEVNRYRNWLLSKWMTKGDTNMRKHLRLIVQYWRHIRNDNLWNAKILKTMAVKAPLTTQIALWRMMLFRRRQYTCHPKLVNGLLSLIRLVDSRQMMRGLRCIQGQERPRNDFQATMTSEKKRPEPVLFQSETVAKESMDEDFGIKSQRLYSLFTYMGIIQKRAKLQVFYKFLEQVKAEPVHRKLLRFEPKALEPTDQSDSGVRAVKFLLDQLGRSRNELAVKTTQVHDLQSELDDKNENLLFMQVFLLNMALRRTERAMHRVFARNATLAAFQLIEALKTAKVKKVRPFTVHA